MDKKIVYVGGGVSTVFSIIKLLELGFPGKNITVFEKGNSSKIRKSDEIMNGFFGAGSFSDYKICYSLSQGGELSKYTGTEKGLELIKQVKKIIRKFHANSKEIEIITIKDEPDFIKQSPFKLRQSETEHLGTEYGQQMGKIIEKYLVDNKVNLMFNTEVTDIDFDLCKIIHSKGETEYDKLIIATGKSGMDFLDKIIKKYKLPTIPKAAQIGVRFESDYKYFKKLAKDFYDFKLYQRINDEVSIRTFCVNNLANYISVEEVEGMKSYNGHAYKDKNKENSLTNFGIIMEIKKIGNPFKFTKNLVKKCNKGNIGKYYTPGNRKPTAEGKKISIEEFRLLYGKYSNYIEQFIVDLDKTFHFGNNFLFYLPEIKYLVKETCVQKNDLSLINYPDVYISGDSLSSRGILVSSCQGLYVSEGIIRSLK